MVTICPLCSYHPSPLHQYVAYVELPATTLANSAPMISSGVPVSFMNRSQGKGTKIKLTGSFRRVEFVVPKNRTPFVSGPSFNIDNPHYSNIGALEQNKYKTEGSDKGE